MAGDGYANLHRAHESFLAEADETRAAAPRASLVDAVEIDEEHRFAGAVRMRDAGPQAAGNERQVRVGVARFDRALVSVEIGAFLEPVVLVAGALGKNRAERVDVRRHVLRAEPGGQAA